MAAHRRTRTILVRARRRTVSARSTLPEAHTVTNLCLAMFYEHQTITRATRMARYLFGAFFKHAKHMLTSDREKYGLMSGAAHRRDPTRRPPPARTPRPLRPDSRAHLLLNSMPSLLTISSTFHPLFKVLFIFRSRYLFTIGLQPIFSFSGNLPAM